MANNTIFFPALFCRINARVDIAFKCNNKCANFKKTGIFEQSCSSIEGKWRDRMKNNADVTRIVTYNCRKMAICCFLLLCIKVSWRHLANLKQMLHICALPTLDLSFLMIVLPTKHIILEVAFLLILPATACEFMVRRCSSEWVRRSYSSYQLKVKTP